MAGLEHDNTWTVVVDSKWVFEWKSDEHGYMIKAKARLMSRGYSQEIGDISTS